MFICGQTPEPTIKLFVCIEADLIIVDKLVLTLFDLLDDAEQPFGYEKIELVGLHCCFRLLEHLLFKLHVQSTLVNCMCECLLKDLVLLEVR